MFIRPATGPEDRLATRTHPEGLRIRATAPSPTTSADTSLPTTTILSLGLGFIGAALLAIIVTLCLRFWFVTRVYPQRTGHAYPSRRQRRGGGPDGAGAENGIDAESQFWTRFAGWWATFWAGPGAEFWEPHYVVKRRQRRPEMWEVLLDEKTGGGGRDSRLSRESWDSPQLGKEKASLDFSEAGDVGAGKEVVSDVGPSRSVEASRGPDPKLVHISEEEDELDELGERWQVRRPSIASRESISSAPTQDNRASAGASSAVAPSPTIRRGSTGNEIAISVLLLMPSPGNGDDIPDIALGTAYLSPEAPLPPLEHVRSRAPGNEHAGDDLVVEVIPTQARYPPSFAELAMVRF